MNQKNHLNHFLEAHPFKVYKIFFLVRFSPQPRPTHQSLKDLLFFLLCNSHILFFLAHKIVPKIGADCCFSRPLSFFFSLNLPKKHPQTSKTSKTSKASKKKKEKEPKPAKKRNILLAGWVTRGGWLSDFCF